MQNGRKLLEDLLRDSRLKAWVNDGDYDLYWESWKADHPNDLDTLADAIAMLQGLPVRKVSIDPMEINASFDLLMNNDPVKGKVKKMHSRRKWLSYAAVLLALSGIFFWLNMSNSSSELLLTISTEVGEKKLVTLPDSSVVVLNGNSKLEYFVDESAHSRKVLLEGDALFKVQKKPNSDQAKFTVETQGAQVEVLGTTFSVMSDSIWTTVVLEEGKVQLNLESKMQETRQSLMMSPGEKIQFNNLSGQVDKHLIDAGRYNLWTEDKLSLVDRSVEELIRWFNHTYGITLLVPEGHLQTGLSGTISLENTETAVQMMAMALGLKPLQVEKNIWEFRN